MKTNAKKQTKIESNTIANDVALTVADVARELNLDPKRARAFLRKHVELYVARHQRFTRESSLFKKTHDALIAYRDARKIITE